MAQSCARGIEVAHGDEGSGRWCAGAWARARARARGECNGIGRVVGARARLKRPSWRRAVIGRDGWDAPAEQAKGANTSREGWRRGVRPGAQSGSARARRVCYVEGERADVHENAAMVEGGLVSSGGRALSVEMAVWSSPSSWPMFTRPARVRRVCCRANRYTALDGATHEQHKTSTSTCLDARDTVREARPGLCLQGGRWAGVVLPQPATPDAMYITVCVCIQYALHPCMGMRPENGTVSPATAGRPQSPTLIDRHTRVDMRATPLLTLLGPQRLCTGSHGVPAQA